MAVTLPKRHLTYEDFKLLPDDQRYELVKGELRVTPAPADRHQALLLALTLRLGPFIREHKLGRLRFAPEAVVLAPGDVVQPDLLFISTERTAVMQRDGVHGAPDLVAEILSPCTASYDQGEKRQTYSDYGVREYWLVDPETETIQVLTQQGSGLEVWQRFAKDDVLTSPLFPGLCMNLVDIFTEE
jgi:Uma2 family endonuclease